MSRRLIAIVGPTGSGKSAIALELAYRLGGEIINADSRQVYRGMDIGTAKPTSRERQLVPHHLFDIADPAEGYSLALYQRHARAALEAIWSRGSLPWLVGGSGQYVWSLLENWQVPAVEPDLELRETLVSYAQLNSVTALHDKLALVDPLAASRIDARNVRRVVRAIEVFERTGRPISEWQSKGVPDFEFLIFGIERPKPDLGEQIGARVRGMFEAGFVDEVRSLLESGLAADAPSMSSIGYSLVAALIQGELTLEAAIEETARATRRLARRQAQWFRASDQRITWARDAGEIEEAARLLVSVARA